MKEFVNSINIDDYNYMLPEERIAQYPAKERDISQLLIYRSGEIKKDVFRNIADYLPSDALLVFNNTKVIRARLIFTRPTGSKIEILLLEPLNPADYELSFASCSPVEWKCLIGNLKKWKKGTLSLTFTRNKKEYKLFTEKTGSQDEAWRIKLSWEPGDICFSEVIESAGHIPLPPYINRNDEESDYSRYQTIYGMIDGSIAAPTAGLHFTKNVMGDILNKGIKTTEITLHIGAGTFQPVRSHNIRDHPMHCEHFSLNSETIETLLSYHGRIIAVGTTSVRTLESLYWLGEKATRQPLIADNEYFTDQWEPYQNDEEISVRKSLESLLKIMEKNGTDILHASTRIMIIPGYRFRMIKGMVTNFHQPSSTLLLLVSAWIGDDWKKVYDFAIHNNFRFLSYGDSSLLIK